MNLKQLIGQKLVIGIPSQKVTIAIIRHFKELHAGGLILYRINFESTSQIKKLISNLEEAIEQKLIVTADHEGGRVIMFREGITVFPDNLAIGNTHNINVAQQQGMIEAKELRRLGIDINLGPVLDVLTTAYSPNIGIRSYGTNWKEVSQMGIARIQAMQKNGISACAKHFPGKGHAPVDAHLGLPIISSTWNEMEKIHLRPFIDAIQAGVDCIMSSHPYYPKLDPNPAHIATFSRKIIYDTLRKRLKFNGLIISDDLEMGAVKTMCSIGEAAIKATQAGHDLLLVCHDLNAQKEVFYSLLKAYENKTLSISELEESVERIQKIKQLRSNRFEKGKALPEKSGKDLTKRICSQSITVLNQPQLLGKKELKNIKISIFFPKFSFYDKKIMIEKEILNETSFLYKEFKKYNFKPSIQIVSIEPTDTEIKKAVRLALKSETILYFCFDAHLYPSNKKLLDALQSTKKNMITALLRDPYDIEFIHPKTACLTNFGWRVCQIQSIIQRICA